MLYLNTQQKYYIAKMKSLRVWSDFHNNLLNEIDECRELSKYGGEPLCMLFCGNPGAGKSELINKYRNQHRRQEQKDRSVLPVVYSTLPTAEKVTNHRLVKSVLKAIGQEIEDYNHLDVDELIEVLKDYTTALRIEMFIIDECHRFLEHESRKVVYEATECLKTMILATKKPFILFGMPWCLYAIEQNAQLASRFLRRRHLKPFYISDKIERENYLGFLSALDEKLTRALNFRHLAQLSSKEIALRLFSVSRGNLRLLRSIIDQAVSIAVRESTDSITFAHLRKACDIVSPDGKNPFKQQDLNEIEFTELAKPSYWDPNAKRGRSPVVDDYYESKGSLAQVLTAR